MYITVSLTFETLAEAVDALRQFDRTVVATDDTLLGSPVPPPPVPPSPPPLAPTGGPDFDSTGLPWDARIHSDARSKNADGSWRKKRGMNDEGLKNRIEAELRAAVSAGSSPNGTAAPAVPAPAPPVPAPVPITPTTPPAPASVDGETFGQFMARIAPGMTANPAKAMPAMSQALATVGLTGVGQLAVRTDLLATVSQTYDALMATA